MVRDVCPDFGGNVIGDHSGQGTPPAGKQLRSGAVERRAPSSDEFARSAGSVFVVDPDHKTEEAMTLCPLT